MKLSVKDYGMTMHMNGSNGHVYVYSGKIDQPGHDLHEKEIVCTRFSPKKKDKDKPWVKYHAADGTTQPPGFDKLEDLMTHYKLKPKAE